MSLNLLLKGQLRYLNQFYDVTAISGSGQDLEEVRIREKVKTHEIEMEREISPLKDVIALIKLYRYFKQEKPEIVHSITPKAGLLSMLASRAAGVPVRMHTFTGLIFPYKKGIFKKLLIWMDRLLANSATHIYPEGQGVKNDLEQYRITRKPLKILANGNVNGIDPYYFDPSQIPPTDRHNLQHALQIADNDFVFIFVGRLVRDKGINELVAAFKTLQSITAAKNDQPNLVTTQHPTPSVQHPASGTQHPTPLTSQPTSTIKLLLVGPLEQDLDPLNQQTLEEIQTNPNIISVGFQAEVRPYFAISDALVFPSYREGFPNVVLQSLGMNLPAIVTNINGCNEIITHGENGLIVPAKNENELQNAMLKLLTDQELYQQLKANTQPSIQPYHQKAVWEALLAEYQLVSDNKESRKKN